jgi:hypothetical protein
VFFYSLVKCRLCVPLILFSTVVIFMTGCGAGVGDVTGTVNYKGTPLKAGNITLVSEESGPSFSGNINEDGTFTITKVRGGKYKVCVETESLKPAGTASGAGSGGSGSSFAKGKTGPAAGSYNPGSGADLQKKFESKKLKTGPTEERESPKGYRDGFAVMAELAARYTKIPAKYAKPETTDLTFEAKSGGQTLSIELKD